MAKEKKKVELPTPVNILWKDILMISIFGVVDSKRAQEIMDTMLTKILETEAKTIILDILGVAIVDTAVANHLLKITKATKLMGSGCIISGISPAIAQTLVHLGIELGDVATTATLKNALELAFKMIGIEVKLIKEVAKKK